MGSVDKVDTNHGVLCAKKIGVDGTEGFPAKVIITVASGSLEHRFRHFVCLEGGENFLCIVFSDGVNAGKLL